MSWNLQNKQMHLFIILVKAGKMFFDSKTNPSLLWHMTQNSHKFENLKALYKLNIALLIPVMALGPVAFVSSFALGIFGF